MASPETQSLVRNRDSGQLDTEPQPPAPQRSTYAEVPTASSVADAAPPNSSQITLVTVPELQAHEEATAHKVESTPAQLRPSPWSQWWMEIMCSLLMTGTLIAIVVTLSHYNGEALPDLPFSVSINTVISILGTTLKTNAGFILAEGISHLKWQWFRSQRLLRDLDVFDRASRGPWGCAKLLFARPNLPSSFAAILTILTLAIDPFTQQLIRYNDCKPENTKLNATLPRANVYFEPWLSRPFQPEIDRGIFSPLTIKPPFSCPSGNCTFHQPYATVGFCSICEDMTSQLTFKNASVPVNSLNNKDRTFYGERNAIVVNVTLPSGSFAWSSSVKNPGLVVSNVDYGTWFEIIQPPDTYLNGEPMFRRHRTSKECQTEAAKTTWACGEFGGAGAARCTVRPCVKSYKADVEQGQLKEELLTTHLMDEKNGWTTSLDENGDERPNYVYAAADLACAGPETVSRLQKEGFRFENDTSITRWDAATDPNTGKVTLLDYFTYPNSSIGRRLNETNLPVDIIPAECLYAIVSTSIWDLKNGLENLVGSTKASEGPSQLLAIYNEASANFDSISTIFNNIAESLTLRLRQYDDPDILKATNQTINQLTRGKVLEQKTCISVQWGYLAFPTALVVFTTAFLSFVVTRALMVDPELEVAAGWKSSPLPMVLCGLDLADSEASRVHLRAGDSVQEMEMVANTVTGRLKMD